MVMDIGDMAKVLGSRGGRARAVRLSRRRRAEIARRGGRARAASVRLAQAIDSNFEYLRALHALQPPPRVRSVSACRRRLPGLYASQGQA
jgi:general stress protein YciG